MGILDLLKPNIFGEKQTNKLGGQASGWTRRTRVQNFRILSLHNGVDIFFLDFFVRKKCVICVIAFNYLVSEWDQLWAINMT